MPSWSFPRFVAAALVSAAVLFGSVAHAQTAGQDTKIQVRLRDGSIIYADRVERQGPKILVVVPNFSTAPIELDASVVLCMGEACAPAAGAPGKAAATTGPPRFGMHGSNTIGGRLMPALLKAFSKSRFGADAEIDDGAKEGEKTIYLGGRESGEAKGIVDIAAHGSATAFDSLARGTASIGMASRPITGQEFARLTAAGFAAPTSIFALDGVAVIVNAQNPVAALSIDEIASIFSGEIRDWSQVGGPAGAIKIYAPAEESGTWDTFNTSVLSPRSRGLAPEAHRLESIDLLSDSVAQDANGIGFVGMAYVGNAKALGIRGQCGIVSKPSPFVVKTEQYPLTRRLFLYTNGTPPSPLVIDFLNFVLSSEAQPVIEDSGFVSQTIRSEPFEEQAQRLRTMLVTLSTKSNVQLREFVDKLRDATLTTTAFRFRSSSSDLDDKAQQDVRAVVAYLKDKKIDPSRVMLVGFTDAVGTTARNVSLSKGRAQSVGNAIAEAGFVIPQQNMMGFGPVSPLACNDDDAGRTLNRRVELWIKN
jgi:phosphate transport system substrate-binding protein